jgi:hypothetical protein
MSSDKYCLDFCGIPFDTANMQDCDGRTTQWFDNWHDIPLDKMVAENSVWLPPLLNSSYGATNFNFDGWFRFESGGLDTNTILHYYLNVREATTSTKQEEKNGGSRDTAAVPYASPKDNPPTTKAVVSSFALEQRLFHALHARQLNSPSLKEFNEAYAFVQAVRLRHQFDVVLDVAGGHGALAALFLVCNPSTKEAVVIDPAIVGGNGVERAWKSFFPDKALRYRHECLRRGLPSEIKLALTKYPRERILVVACHACQHLSDELLRISCDSGVNVAVMPCCQRDTSPGTAWKAASKNLNIPVPFAMDLLLAGKAMSWHVGKEHGEQYDVRMKVINPKITPQNRLILCRAFASSNANERVEAAHVKLERTYAKAHRNASNFASGSSLEWPSTKSVLQVLTGFVLGSLATIALMKRCS